MQRHLFDHVNLPARRIHFLNGAVAPGEAVQRECDRYERAIDRAGGIDLQILGLGMNGHIGFNEPARALVARTHCTRLKPATRRANAPLFGNRVGAVPREALSMGMATILHARRIVLLATGVDESALRGADDRGAGDAAAAGVVSAAAPARGSLAGSCSGVGIGWNRHADLPISRSSDLQQLLQPRFDVLADRVAHEVVRLAQPRQRLRCR